MNGEDSNVEEAIDNGIDPDWTNPKINVSITKCSDIKIINFTPPA